MSDGSTEQGEPTDGGMKRAAQWERIEGNINTIAELIHQIAGVLTTRNQQHPVHKAVSLSDPDIAFLLNAIADIETAAVELEEDHHSDTVQQVALEDHRRMLVMLADLCEAMKDLDQSRVDKIVGQLRERL